MGADIGRKEKVEKTIEFAERMKEIQEEGGVTLKKIQEEMKKQVDRRRKKAEIWKKGNKMILSIKYLVFKEQLVKKLVDWYVSLYIIEEIVFTNIVKLELSTIIRIYLVINMSWVVRYRELVRR